MKKFVSIAVALVMVLSLSVVAFADTTIASVDAPENGTLAILDGADFTDESLYLVITYELTDSEKIGWGPVGICPSDWTNILASDQGIVVDESGVISIALTDIAAAFEAAGYDANDGVVMNWWGSDYATLLSVALVSTSDDAAAAETEETTEEAEATEEATEETTEAAEETTTTTTTSPSTGVALALVPMAIAGFAVVSSKRR